MTIHEVEDIDQVWRIALQEDPIQKALANLPNEALTPELPIWSQPTVGDAANQVIE